MINLRAAACFTYALFHGYLAMVQKKNNEKAALLQQLMTDIYFTYPIDALRRLVTNVLFMQNITDFDQLTADIPIKNLICPYLDIK